MKRCCLFLTPFLLASCMLKGKKTTVEVISHYNKGDDITSYFPSFDSLSYRDSSILFGEALHLSIFEEKPINEYALTSPVIRFIYRPSFSKFMVIRINNQQAVVKRADQTQEGFNFREDESRLSDDESINQSIYDAVARFRHVDEEGNRDTTASLPKMSRQQEDKEYELLLFFKQLVPGADSIIYTKQTTDINHSQIRELLTRVDQSGFWNMAVASGPEPGLDGSHWTLEVMHNGKRHIVSMWSPDSGSFYELGKYVLRTYGQLKDNEIY